jgi:quercetin dioxygenase-like cupin family protein|tara:strand:- start:218 stop:706 length:489 start_codon:yes stop_codon:yes gene_type:complete
MSENKIKSNNNQLTNFTSRLEDLQNVMIENNDIEGVYGDGKTLVNNEVFRIEHEFADQLYMRKMYMPANSVVVSAIHHTEHFWFLLKGTIFVTTDGEEVKHIAPCYTKSMKGAKRLIIATEDTLFINVHKNPTNTQELEEIEQSLYSMTVEEYNKQEELWQE